MRITSPAFADKQPVPLPYTCNGPNVSPPFEFLDVPKETKSLALVVEDTDSSNQWVHWLVYNIPGHVTYLEEGKIPTGAVNGICNGGTYGYEGPCPKYFHGIHHYCFRLYALDTVLDVPPDADKRTVLSSMEGHILSHAELVGIAEGEQVSTPVNHA